MSNLGGFGFRSVTPANLHSPRGLEITPEQQARAQKASKRLRSRQQSDATQRGHKRAVPSLPEITMGKDQ